MAMRLTGLMSGIDTESIITELVAAKRTKVDTAKKEQTKLEWKQEAWKELNTKILNLYNNSLGNLRYESSYLKKTTKVSNSNAVSVITGENAVNGVQDLQINKLAKTAYLTGAEVKAADGDKVTGATKISELGTVKDGATITLNGETILTVDGSTTVNDFLTALKDKGLNASFDEKNQRFFVSAKESGVASDFELYGYGGALTALGLYTEAGATKIDGQDAEITLNGAKFTSSTNVFEINGLTLTAHSTTAVGETITVTTEDDTDGIYDMIKKFITEYNTLINEMDKLYNAESAKDYEPLTDEEKEEMSEKAVEQWEQKIKDSILRKDTSLNSISSAMKQIMAQGVEVNGQKMYLSNFGIGTLSYFSSADNEKNAYHIDGDPDDSNTSGNADKLKGMIASDPDTVVDFFTSLSKSLYSKMTDLMKSTVYSSSYTAYDDKKMKEEYNDYTSKIAELEKKLNEYEDKWYKKFAAMETAMAKLQSNSSAVTSMLGGM